MPRQNLGSDRTLVYGVPRGRGQEWVAPTAEELAPFVPEDERDYIAATPEPPTVGLCRECEKGVTASALRLYGYHCSLGCLREAHR